MRELGISTVRVDVDWQTVQPSPGQFDFSRTDRLFDAAARHDIKVLGILGYSPDWASTLPPERHAPPSPEAYAKFTSAIVSRYGTRSARYPGAESPLAAVEVWNEPFDFTFWKPEPNPADYASLVRAATSAARAADPAVDVLMSGDLLQYRTDGQRPWLAELIARDVETLKAVDGISIHPYADPKGLGPTSRSPMNYTFYDRVAKVRAQLEAAGIDRPLWVTEIGWCTEDPVCGSLSEATQARHLDTALTMLQSNTEWNVDQVFVYTWNRIDPQHWTGRFGLHRSDGSAVPALSVVSNHALSSKQRAKVKRSQSTVSGSFGDPK